MSGAVDVTGWLETTVRLAGAPVIRVWLKPATNDELRAGAGAALLSVHEKLQQYQTAMAHPNPAALRESFHAARALRQQAFEEFAAFATSRVAAATPGRGPGLVPLELWTHPEFPSSVLEAMLTMIAPPAPPGSRPS